MLKGHVFNLQTFTSEAFALFIDKFLNGRCGVAKGCELSNTSNSATVGEGYFVVRGRFLQIISGETISNITANGYYSLVCEIDLSKTNTADALNQAAIKAISSTSTYPILTQQDITGTGTVYQYEFARFKVESGSITNFTDKRTFVSYGQILTLIQNELEALEQQSNVSLKSDFAVLTGVIPGSSLNNGVQFVEVDFPAGFNASNCVVVSTMVSVHNENWFSEYEGRASTTLRPDNNKVSIDFAEAWGADMDYKLVLMKIS